MPRSHVVVAWSAVVMGSLMPSLVMADSVSLTPTKDNTLFESATGAVSNGAGPLFSGRVRGLGGNIRQRAVLAFDVAGNIPAGSTITSATLQLRLSAAHSLSETHTLHKLLADWGESTGPGASNTDAGTGAPAAENDATWIHRFYHPTPPPPSLFWTTIGGDFVATASASTVVGNNAETMYSWSSPQMAADVQGWLNSPATNFGWLLKGNEVSTGTARKFYSKEFFDPPGRPHLTIVYTPPPPCPADIDHSGSVNVNDLLNVITHWGPCPAPCPPPCSADISPSGGNCQVNVNDLLLVITSWGPCP